MNTKARVTAVPTARLPLRRWLALAILAFGAALLSVRPVPAQEAPALTIASDAELRELVGPIALYPDDLVGLVLPASTYPLQVVQAQRFLEDRERDANLQPPEEWDDSIVALLNYPEVVKLMNDDLDWTYDLGTAVLNQRADVLDAIQNFRNEAYAAGNLRSDERQNVVRADKTIEIKPADPQVIYVPYYEPERVVIYQPAPVYYYYPRPYPVYYYPYPAGHHFHTGFFWGVNSWFSIGWHSHHVHVYDPFYHGHPYHGWAWHSPFFVRNVYVNVNHVHRYPNYVWEPRYRYGGRPVVRGSEGRVYSSAQRTPRRSGLDANAALARTREAAPYRQRSAVTTQRATQAAEARRPAASTANGSAAPTYRGGMAQQLERTRGVVPRDPEGRASPARTNPTVSPRAVERSTGSPREATRAAPSTRAPTQAPAARAPAERGGMGAQRSESGGGYRGNAGGNSGGNSGGAYRGGGGSQRAAQAGARGSEGRSAAR